jgi:cobalt-zinc-cadmium efflux system membrane fusion protein
MRHSRLLAAAILAIAVASCVRSSAPSVPKDTDADAAKAATVAKDTAKGIAEKGDKEDVVELSAEAQRRIGVIVAPAEEAPLAIPLQVTGSVQAIESRLGHVRPLAHGRVGDVLAGVGDHVSSGQSLATFDNIEAGELISQYNTARAELGRLRAQLATLARQVERSRRLVEIGAAPQKEYDASVGEQRQLEESIHGQESTLAGMEARLRRFGVSDPTAGDRPAATAIRAPFGGVVTKVNAGPGEVVDSAVELFSVADISRVYVQAQVYEKDLGRVVQGQAASVRVDAYPEERFTGRVVSIGDTIDPQTRTATVRCDVANPKGLLKLDMFATVDLPTTVSKKALVVPNEAVQTLEGRTIVFVKSTPSKFVARTVERGRTAGALTEIVRGLKAGEPVVTRGAFQVKSAQQAKELGEKE